MEAELPDRHHSLPHRPAQALCLGLAAVTTLVVGVVSEPRVVPRTVLTTIRGMALTYTPLATAGESEVFASPAPAPKVVPVRHQERRTVRPGVQTPRRIATVLGRLGGLYGP